MPASATDGDVKEFEVDPSTRAGLDTATPEARRAVEEAIRSKEDFLARISDPSRVFRLRPNDPYYALKVTPRLRLIDTREGDRIAVEILTNQGFLDRYASMGGDEPKSASRKRATADQSWCPGRREGDE
jgi:hypothetical protein